VMFKLKRKAVHLISSAMRHKVPAERRQVRRRLLSLVAGFLQAAALLWSIPHAAFTFCGTHHPLLSWKASRLSRIWQAVMPPGVPPDMPGGQQGPPQTDSFEELCERWNREEAENVERSKRLLQSGDSTKEVKRRAIDELEYWAVRRGGYDAEIVLIGALRTDDQDLSGRAHLALKKTWESHFNAWVNNIIITGQDHINKGDLNKALEIFEGLVTDYPLWGQGYRLRAQVYNKWQDYDRVIEDLQKCLELCPNNYLVMSELAITLMERRKDYDGAAKLFGSALDLCHFLPVNFFTKKLYQQAPHLQEVVEHAKISSKFSPDAPPPRLLPHGWVEKEEAIDRPNQAFLRLGAEIEQWFTQLKLHNLSPARQRKLWSTMIVAWDPDKHRKELQSFTQQVHDLLLSKRTRKSMLADLDKEVDEANRKASGNDMDEPPAAEEENVELLKYLAAQDAKEQEEADDPRAFLEKRRAARRQRQAEAAAA